MRQRSKAHANAAAAGAKIAAPAAIRQALRIEFPALRAEMKKAAAFATALS